MLRTCFNWTLTENSTNYLSTTAMALIPNKTSLDFNVKFLKSESMLKNSMPTFQPLYQDEPVSNFIIK